MPNKETLREKIKEAVIATYPDDIWLPVPENMRAKDGIAAQCMRDMSGAIAHISCQVFEEFLDLHTEGIRKAIKNNKIKNPSFKEELRFNYAMESVLSLPELTNKE